MKRYKYSIFIIFFFVATQSCANTELLKCGTEWINIHKDNTDLIGVYVQQFPDNVEDRADYINKHPVMIIFLFKNDRAHTVTYTPIGQVQNGVWWDVSQSHWVRKVVSTDFKFDRQCAYWK